MKSTVRIAAAVSLCSFPRAVRNVALRIIDELRRSMNEWLGLLILIHRVDEDAGGCAHHRSAPVAVGQSQDSTGNVVIRKQVIPDERLPFQQRRDLTNVACRDRSGHNMFSGPENVNIVVEFLDDRSEILGRARAAVLRWAKKQHWVLDCRPEILQEFVGTLCLLRCRLPRQRNGDIVIQETKMAYAYFHHFFHFLNDFHDVRVPRW